MTKEALEDISLSLGTQLTKSNKALALAQIADLDDDEAKKLIESMKLKEPLNGRFLSIWLGWLCMGRLYNGDKGYVKGYFITIAVLVALTLMAIWLFPNIRFEIFGESIPVGALPMFSTVLFVIWHCTMDAQFVLTGIFKDNMQKFMMAVEAHKANTKGGDNE